MYNMPAHQAGTSIVSQLFAVLTVMRFFFFLVTVYFSIFTLPHELNDTLYLFLPSSP